LLHGEQTDAKNASQGGFARQGVRNLLLAFHMAEEMGARLGVGPLLL
jgi:hypothetical protein